MDKKPSKLSILTNGIIKENPVLVLLLGTCATLATTTSAINGVGMGVSTMVVLICSNIVISLIRNIVPGNVRIPCYIVVIAGFVTVVQLMLKAYAPALDASLGLFIPLIVVNCIILGRAEMFASKNGPLDSALDGIGMGLGFTLALFCMGFIRELLGSGMIFGAEVIPQDIIPGMSIFNMPPGGFFTFALLVAIVNKLKKGKDQKKEFSCEGCAMAGLCGVKEEDKPAAKPAAKAEKTEEKGAEA